MIETDDGNYIVPIYNYSNYSKSDVDATIIRITSDGLVLNELKINIDDEYILNDIARPLRCKEKRCHLLFRTAKPITEGSDGLRGYSDPRSGRG